ncbi:MAG: tRNA adenosine(34) deaminase TadA [Myxococcota bacterium]|nr:tRNA adenosine(34) deaminase TadA [Myxococcota bacterium]
MSGLDHNRFMARALALAADAASIGEVPVGAVIVHDGQIIGEGANRRESDQDPTSHAEIIAIRQAAAHLGSWRLTETALYVTLEPCPMCAGAIVNARIPLVVYGIADPKAGAVHTLYELLQDPRLNHRCEVIAGIGDEQAAALLQSFFEDLRRKKKK